MPEYRVNRTCKIGARIVFPGSETVELKAQTAAPLVASGSLTPANADRRGKRPPKVEGEGGRDGGD